MDLVTVGWLLFVLALLGLIVAVVGEPPEEPRVVSCHLCGSRRPFTDMVLTPYLDPLTSDLVPVYACRDGAACEQAYTDGRPAA